MVLRVCERKTGTVIVIVIKREEKREEIVTDTPPTLFHFKCKKHEETDVFSSSYFCCKFFKWKFLIFQELNQKLSDMKEQYARDLRDNDKRWRSCLDKKMDEVEEKYKEEINELTKEWTIDRKVCGSAFH